MPRVWSDKDERKYEHIKESSLERGVAEDEAEEIAARTVNKGRRKRGETPNRRTQGTGNPHKPLEQRTRDELYNLAKEAHIAGRSGLTKAQLVERLQNPDRASDIPAVVSSSWRPSRRFIDDVK